MHQRQVAVLQPLEVTHHLGLAVVAVEDRMAEHHVRAAQPLRDRGRLERQFPRHALDLRPLAGEHLGDVGDVLQCRGLVQAHGDARGIQIPQVDALLLCARLYLLGRSHVEYHGIEKFSADGARTAREQARHEIRALSDARKAARAVVDGVEAGHVGKQRLRGADVARRLLAADMLLARLQRHAQCRPPGGVARHADDATRHGALVLVAAGHERGMRAAVAHRHAEALRRADGDIRAHRPRRAQQHQGEKIGADRDQPLRRVHCADRLRPVADAAVRVGVLKVGAEHRSWIQFLRIAGDELDAEPLRARAHHREHLRMRRGVDEECRCLALRAAPDHRHGFGGCGGLVEQRGIRHR